MVRLLLVWEGERLVMRLVKGDERWGVGRLLLVWEGERWGVGRVLASDLVVGSLAV